jgi:hypothetical protein
MEDTHMTDEIERLITPEDENAGGETHEWSAADVLTGGEAPAGAETPSSAAEILDHMPQGGWAPTPEDMESTNTTNAEGRAKAIADGMDEGTADILYPEFSTPEDMLKIN